MSYQLRLDFLEVQKSYNEVQPGDVGIRMDRDEPPSTPIQQDLCLSHIQQRCFLHLTKLGRSNAEP